MMADLETIGDEVSNNSEFLYREDSVVTPDKTGDGFVAAILVWINKPHVTNRRLVGSKLLARLTHRPLEGKDDIRTFLESMKKGFGSVKVDVKSGDINQESFTCNDGGDNRGTKHHDVTMISECDHYDVHLQDLSSSTEDLIVFIRDLLPKNLDLHQSLREVITYDKQNQEFNFYPLVRFNKDGTYLPVDDEILYTFRFVKTDSDNRITLGVHGKPGNNSPGSMSYSWLKDNLLNKLSRWAGEENLRTEALSLRTVSVEAYNRLYNELKVKYGPDLIKSWPERTDPQKFVYEDIAIVTFLLLTWEKERQETGCPKQSFVDLGCGNGLLVYLLMSEGHPGLGIDIQKRKIWDIFGPNTNLEIRALKPSADTLFPEYDWIIGNHSDELTPWIPMIAARSSYRSRFFVLPCCLFDFDRKFTDKDRGSSQYRTYLNYIYNVGEVCGFKVEEDTLRIPSTKRACLIGRKRTYSESNESEMDEKRSNFIHSRCKKAKMQESSFPSISSASDPTDNMPSSHDNKSNGFNDDSEMWSASFKPRPAQKVTGMCKKVPMDIKTEIVNKVVQKILTSENNTILTLPDGRLWHKGAMYPEVEYCLHSFRKLISDLTL